MIRAFDAVADLNSAIVHALDAAHPGATWDVRPGDLCDPDDVVCRSYPSASLAHGALLKAGYAVTNRFIAPGTLDGCDRSSVLRYERDGEARLILVRRRSGS